MTIKEQIEAIASIVKEPQDKINKFDLSIKLMQLAEIASQATEVPVDVFSGCDDDMRQLAVMGMVSIMLQTVLK